jgi:hypothetical protein
MNHEIKNNVYTKRGIERKIELETHEEEREYIFERSFLLKIEKDKNIFLMWLKTVFPEHFHLNDFQEKKILHSGEDILLKSFRVI